MLEHDNDLFCDVIKHVFVIGYMGMLLADSHCHQHKNEKKSSCGRKRSVVKRNTVAAWYF